MVSKCYQKSVFCPSLFVAKTFQLPSQISDGKRIESGLNSAGCTEIQGRGDKGGLTILGKVIVL